MRYLIFEGKLSRFLVKANSRNILFGGIAILLAIFVCLVAGEVLIRVFRIGPEINVMRVGTYQRSDNPVLRYELAPNAPDGRLAISDAGLRDRDYPVEKPPNVFRIAVIGDSIAFGEGVEQSAVMSEHLELLLNKHGADSDTAFEVLNFGVAGYNFQQVMEALRAKALSYSPDLIVYAYCMNDPQEYSLEMAKLDSVSSGTSTVFDYVPLHRSRFFLLARYALTRPDFDRDDPQGVALESGTYAEYFSRIHRATSWNRMQTGLDDLADLSSAREIPVLALVFPVLLDLEDYPLEPVHDLLNQAFTERSLHVLDLLDLYAAYERIEGRQVGRDSLHPGTKGHAFTAVAMLYSMISHFAHSRDWA